MNHVWQWKEWKNLKLGEVHGELLNWSDKRKLKSMGDLTVKELCCLASSPWNPVGIYVFLDKVDNRINYVGKTHGRSFQERMLSHLDHRMPIPGSPHLAQFVQSLSKKEGITSDEAVSRTMDMKMIWMPIPDLGKGNDFRKVLIAAIERRLLWHGCLDPGYNSKRVKHNDYFTMKGSKYILSESECVGDHSLLSVK